MKKRSFRSTFVSVILVITVAISIVNLAVYGINIKKIRQVEVLKMKTAGERIDDMITISLNNIKGLKQMGTCFSGKSGAGSKTCRTGSQRYTWWKRCVWWNICCMLH